MPIEDLERVYEALALAIDQAGPDDETTMLARLVLLLANRLGDAEATLTLIDQAVASGAAVVSTSS